MIVCTRLLGEVFLCRGDGCRWVVALVTHKYLSRRDRRCWISLPRVEGPTLALDGGLPPWPEAARAAVVRG